MLRHLITSSSICMVAMLISTPLAAQQSPARNSTATISGKAVRIDYSAPSVRGRQIFGAGGLLSKDPTYPVWRAGANAATTLKTDAALDLGGLRVPAGTYTLYVNVGDPAAWELIVSKQTGQWGLDYDAKQDLGRVKMTMSAPAAPVETLRWAVQDKGNGAGELRLEWERHTGTVAVRIQ